MNEAQIVAYLAVFLAVFLRTTMPYWRKRNEDLLKNEAPRAFNWQYVGTAISAGITSFVIATLLFAGFTMPTTTDLFMVFVSAFGFGWTTNDIFNDFI